MVGLTALRSTAKGQNGVGAFILQCKKIDFHYCDWGGSSYGMKSFLTSKLADFSKAHPSIEINVSPRSNKHPVLIGHYINGAEKAICVRKLDPNQILQKLDLLRNASGAKNKRIMRKPVISTNESVRGIWSPFHAGTKHQI